MGKLYFYLLLVSCFFLSLSVFSEGEKVVYGVDNRVDVYQSDNLLYRELSLSVAAQINPKYLRYRFGKYYIKGDKLVDLGICSEERFTSQWAVADCTGFLVAPDLIVTAGHCVYTEEDCKASYWVFDYKQADPADQVKNKVVIKKKNIYRCQELVAQNYDAESKLDYAVIRLNREVSDRRPLKFRKSGSVAEKDPLVIIGHPSGLPLKIADGAYVRDNSNSIFFKANLDSFAGNSGSPVFNSYTGLVEGILVRGAMDYVIPMGRDCRIVNICSETGCRGEDATRISIIPELQDL